MHYSLVTFTLALAGLTVSATPITLDASTLAASFPIRQLSVPGGVHPNSTLPSSDFRALAARQEFPANLLLCQLVNCQGCTSFPIQGEIQDTCIAPGFIYTSAAIAQPSNEGLTDFLCDVGTTGCAEVATLPTVNECFNLSGGTFDECAIVVPPPPSD
ncbi:hypothetical protein TRAPUB_533 [Trametes pubescens]|uniref:Uncharacterized protein n=1 Tax=Trametes pubescens TaxID=154538 RepID=A0A1M2VM04_TRAPU|nr:hypothetical protein TRAPUB_533 [Trametes pubescens]